jgi:transcriptional regulator with XRE-family HTH domain
MADEAWRERLEEARIKSGRSKRSVSLGAKMGPGYYHSIMAEGKDPTIDSLIAICRELNVSLTWIIYGFEISPATEQLLSLIEENPEDRAAVLQILQKREKA